MATKEARGTKRTCQIADCGARFYDLNRHPILCPICEMEYRLAPTIVEEEPEEPAEVVEAEPAPAAATANGLDAGDGEEVTDDDALVSLEDADAEIEGDTASEDDEDNTFLASDDDDQGDDVSDIIGPVGGDEEET